MRPDFRRMLIATAVMVFVLLGSVTAAAQTEPVIKVNPRGDSVWLGTAVWVGFDRPMDRTSAEGAFSMEPAVAGDFVWRNEDAEMEYRPAEPLAENATYKVTIDTTCRTARGEPVLERPFSWTFSTRESSQQISFSYGLPVQLVTPSGGRGVPIQPGYPRVTLEFALYEMDLSDFVAVYDDLEPYQRSSIDVAGLERIAQWSAHIDATSRVGEVKLPPAATPGLYVLVARHELLGAAQTVVVHSDYALVAKRGREDLAVWVTTMPAGVPAAGADVSLLDASGNSLDAAAADEDGIARFEFDDGAIFAVADVSGQTTLVGLDNYWCSDYYCGGWWDGRQWIHEPPEHTAHIHTDRPIYRPGHEVHYKATIRHLERDGYSVVQSSVPLTVTIKDASGNTVHSEPAVADEFGSVAGDFLLGDDVALGSWRIEVGVGRQTFAGTYQVEEYVKPDYEVVVETDEPYYVRGDTALVSVQADYYFGQPAAGAEVTLRIYRGHYYWGRGGNQVGEVPGVTDEEGTFETPVTLAGNENNTERYYFEAEVVDASRRPVVEETNVPVHPADFSLNLRSMRYGVEVGQPVVVTASTMDHDGQPVADRAVHLEVREYRRGGYVTLRREQLTTGVDGEATISLAGMEEGWYNLLATAADDSGHRVQANSYAWLYNYRRPWYWWGGLEMNADRESYAPGDTAHILIKSPITTTALITLEREEVYDELVVEVSGATTVDVPIKPEYAPSVQARVQMWEPLDVDHNRAEGRLLYSQINLIVPATNRKLDVQVEADQEIREPGEWAEFEVTVRDQAGDPAVAQLSFALVDKAVLALATDYSGDIFDAFWGPRGSHVGTYDSLRPSQWYGYREGDQRGGPPGGGETPTPAPGPSPGEPGEKDDEASQAAPRREFPDTAYWEAAIVTDATGKATVRLKLPDNLTTWQAMVRAITMDTLAGQGSGEIVVTKPVIADPALPRFAVQGDRFALDVLARNYAGGTLAGALSLESPGLLQLDEGERQLELPFNETRFARWTVVASNLGEDLVTSELDTAAGNDAVELPLEVQPFSVPERQVVSGSTGSEAEETFTIPFNAIPETSSLEVRLSPGIALGILDGLEDLIGYPYGCIEQTMGRMFPNAVVGRLVSELDISAPEITAKLPELMAIGLQKIYGFQHEDGSWGWWRSGGNVYITAYVLHGLTLTEQAGYDVDDEVLEVGFTWLGTNAAAERDPRIRAYALYVLAEAGRGDETATVALFEGRGELDAFALASLALALDKTGHPDLAAEVMDELEAAALETPTTASWPLDVPSRYRWEYYHWHTMASTTKNTAMALEALATLRPESPIATKAARWLMENRWGRGWMSTQATAFAVLALTDYIVASGELWADFDWQVALDDAENVLGQGSVDATNITERIDPVVITGAALTPGQHDVILTKEGEGTLFYTIVAQLALYHEGFEPTGAEGFGVKLTREYTPIKGRSGPDGWHVGDVVNVRLTLETTDALHYVIVEDMLPAGLEALNERLETESDRVPDNPRYPWRWWGYERKELRDEKVTFFDTYLPPGVHTFDYAARAITPGVYSARPAQSYAMYRPDVWGRSASEQVVIDPKRITERPPLPGDYNRDCRLTPFDAALAAADWQGSSRDLNEDGRVDVADITTALGRDGLQCGDEVPLPPGAAGQVTLKLQAPDEIAQGDVFDLAVVLDGDGGRIAAFEAALEVPADSFEVLDLSAGDMALQRLGPVTEGGRVRIGGFSATGLATDGTITIARLRLRALKAGAESIDVVNAVVTDEVGGQYEVIANGTVISPAPWEARGRVYLPHAAVEGTTQ